MAWIDQVMDLLCRIYKELGGECKDLYDAAGKPQPIKVVQQYDAFGLPKFSSPAAKAAFLQSLDYLEELLFQEANSFSTEDTSALLGMIASMRKQLGVG